MRPTNKLSNEVNVQIVCLFQEGQTLQSIADRVGVSRQRVHQIVKAAGLSRRDGGKHVQALTGVSRVPATGRFVATRMTDGVREALGHYATLSEAIEARKAGKRLPQAMTVQEARHTKRKQDLPMGVAKVSRINGKRGGRPYQVYKGQRYVGTFRTVEEAVAAYEAA
jgi:hypothetical protein